jgi:hypothetical protein
MSVQFKPLSTIKVDLGIQEGGPVHKFFTNTCYLHMDKYVPFDSGDLASTVSISNDGKYIIYNMPYASYQWRGEREDGSHKINEENRNRSMHPLATSHWDKKMITAEGDDVIKEVADYMRKHGGK